MKKNNIFYLITLLIILIISSLIIFFFPNIMDRIEYKIFDFYNYSYVRFLPKQEKNPDFLFIEIDSETHRQLNSMIIDRKEFADLNNLLNKCKPYLIFYDYIFSTGTPSDQKLIDSIIYPNYLFPCAMSSQQISNMTTLDKEKSDYIDKKIIDVENKDNQKFYSSEHLVLSLNEIVKKSVYLAHINSYADNDGINRRIPVFINYKNKYIPAASFYFALKIMNKSIDDVTIKKNKVIIKDNSNSGIISIPVNNKGEMFINFTMDRKMAFSKISFIDLMKLAKKDFNMLYELLENKIIIITDSSYIVNDYGKTPISINSLKSTHHAFSAETIINKKFVRILPIRYNIIIFIILSIIIFFSTIKLNANKFILLNFSILFIYIICSIFLFSMFTIYLSIFVFLSFFIISIISILILKYIFEEKEKSFIKYAFSCYLSKTVVSQILKHRDLLQLEGKNTFISILFSDIANFTSISEIISPIELVKFLKYYNTEMSKIVKENNGIIDKYEGDAIMAEFGLPIEIADNEKISAYNACKSAIEMQKRLEEIKEKYTDIDAKNLNIRIGINSGQVIAGNMGSDDLFDYTAIGDEVNLASRLEGANKYYKTKIMIGEKTNNLVKEYFFTRPIDFIRVKGRKTPEKVFELIEFKNQQTNKIYDEFLKNYNNAFELYIKRDYTKALNYLKKSGNIIPDDNVLTQLEIKCKNFIKKPPAKDWDGVTILDSK